MGRTQRGKSDTEPAVTEREAAAPARTGARATLLPVLLTSLLWLVLAGAALLAWRRPQPVAFQVQAPPATATPAATPTPGPIQVEVAGAVLTPGVYALPAGARGADAIAAAGGLAADADSAAVNLARPLQDGEKLVAPTRAAPQPVAAAGLAPLDAARSGGVELAVAGLIDINRAGVEELDQLPGIGPVTAQAIVAYRTANGPFRTVEEIVNVKGIGLATLEKLRALITVGE
ncbi:MAG: helix-hairpin-helix domain-containing protein [Anaerolineae bacterium]|jgi:competence protein ComEA